MAWLNLLSFALATATPVLLKAGRHYVLELSGERQALTVFLRASRSDVYAVGTAHGDGQTLKTSPAPSSIWPSLSTTSHDQDFPSCRAFSSLSPG